MVQRKSSILLIQDTRDHDLLRETLLFAPFGRSHDGDGKNENDNDDDLKSAVKSSIVLTRFDYFTLKAAISWYSGTLLDAILTVTVQFKM